ncbi:YusW family protein [Peribacillus frigoritolerans]|nr:YusW family protein [Peribacillus frigoritolerans]
MTFTKDSTDEEVIQEVTKAFNLKDDYQEFDLEVVFRR